MLRLTFSSEMKEVEGVMGVGGCRSSKEAMVMGTMGSKRPPVLVAEEEAIEEEAVVTEHILAGRDVTTRCCDTTGRISLMVTGCIDWTGKDWWNGMC